MYSNVTTACLYFHTYRAFLQFLTAGISLLLPSFDLKLYLFRSSSSRTSSDIRIIFAKVEHCARVRFFSFFPDVKNACIFSTTEWSLISIKQCDRFIHLSGLTLFFCPRLRLWIIFFMLSVLFSVCISTSCKSLWLESSEIPWRNRRKRSRCPVLLFNALVIAPFRNTSRVTSSLWVLDFPVRNIFKTSLFLCK